MSFTPNFDVSQLMKGVRKDLEKIDKLVFTKLNEIGLQFVIDARSKVPSKEYKSALGSMSHAKGVPRAQLGPESPSFMDQTGHLRSSIGYAIFKNGKVIHDDFENSPEGTDQDTGRSRGYEYAMANAGANIGYILIVVAGMEYAAVVESKGYDVITGSSFRAEEEVKNFINNISKL